MMAQPRRAQGAKAAQASPAKAGQAKAARQPKAAAPVAAAPAPVHAAAAPVPALPATTAPRPASVAVAPAPAAATGLVRPAAKTPASPTAHIPTPAMLRRLRFATVAFQLITTLVGGCAMANVVDRHAQDLATHPLSILAIVVASLAILMLVLVMLTTARRTHRVLNPWHLCALLADAGLIIELTALDGSSAFQVILFIVTGMAAVVFGLAGFSARLEEYK
jgi:hypothetical protein